MAADSNGNLTINPEEATCLIPTGLYKGYGIASMIEVLCGVYTGMQFGRSIPSMYKTPMDQPRKLGQFYIVMRVDGVIDADNFISQMQEMTEEVRGEPSASGESVMLPGDPEIHTAKKRLKDGIPLDGATVQAFMKMGDDYKIPLKFM